MEKENAQVKWRSTVGLTHHEVTSFLDKYQNPHNANFFHIIGNPMTGLFDIFWLGQDLE